MDIPGWKPLIVCGQTGADGMVTNACQFGHLIELARNVITDLVLVSTLIVLFMAIFVGFKLLTSQGNPSALKYAKDVAMKIVIGYLWIIVAWLLVYTIANALLDKKYLFLLGNTK
jgi:hypothetical protein